MKVYFDHSATTPCDKRVVDAMLPFLLEDFGNADSLHSFGRATQKAVTEARQTVATELNCLPNEIYFTASGTEADNWALKGIALSKKDKGKHIIISSIEHHANLTTANFLAKNGFEVTFLPVNDNGIVEPQSLRDAIRDDTFLVSVMYVNNEVGTVQQVKELAEIAHQHDAIFHTDCVQAVPYLKLDVKELGCDLLSISAHKFYGPKGAGALYVKNGLRLERLIHGGGQERSKRGGTTNTASIVGMAKALEICAEEREQNNAYIVKLKDHFIERVEKEIDGIKFNGSKTQCVPSIANFSFEHIEGEGILMLLDFAGIAVSSGSACSAASLEPSHVLLAMGVPIELAHGSIRFSFGKHNTMEEVDYAVDKLKEIVAKLREMSPLFNLKEGEIYSV